LRFKTVNLTRAVYKTKMYLNVFTYKYYQALKSSFDCIRLHVIKIYFVLRVNLFTRNDRVKKKNFKKK